jgi:hypothetical protein
MMWRLRHGEIPASTGEVARREAERHLDEVNAQWPEIRRVARSLRAMRERNHFGEAIQEIMRGNK